MKKIKLTNLLVIAIVAMVVLNVFVSIKLSSVGSVLLGFEKSMAQVNQENRYVREKIVEYTSVSNLSSRVGELGLVKPENIIYLSGENPVASLNK